MTITVSLKDALRERPGRSEQPRGTDGRWGTSSTVKRMPFVNNEVICTPYWTEQEFRTFRHLTDMVYNNIGDPRSRADAAVWLKRFTEQHGKDKCDLMLGELRRLDAIAWFGKKKGCKR